MATSKPISTICYNTVEFLQYKLDTWYKSHLIQSYQYIKHKGEDGDKDHIHLRIEPNKKLDPMDLMDELKEYTDTNKKPLGCRTFRPSVEEDWFLYVVHDKDYLKIKYGGAEKGEKLPYTFNDIVVPDNYDVEIAFIRAKAKLEHTSANMAKRIKNGDHPLDLILEGENVHTVNALMTAISKNDYQALTHKYNDLYLQYEDVITALTDYGLKIVWDYTDDGVRFANVRPTNSEQK